MRQRRQRVRNPLSKFSDDEIQYLYKFFVENQSVSDIAISKDPKIFEKKTLWKYTKNKIYSLIWKLRYMLEQMYGSALQDEDVDTAAANLLKRKMRQSRKTQRTNAWFISV